MLMVLKIILLISIYIWGKAYHEDNDQPGHHDKASLEEMEVMFPTFALLDAEASSLCVGGDQRRAICHIEFEQANAASSNSSWQITQHSLSTTHKAVRRVHCGHVHYMPSINCWVRRHVRYTHCCRNVRPNGVFHPRCVGFQ